MSEHRPRSLGQQIGFWSTLRSQCEEALLHEPRTAEREALTTVACLAHERLHLALVRRANRRQTKAKDRE